MAGCIVCDLGRYRIFLVSVVVLNSLLFVTKTRADCIDDAAAYHHVNPSLARAIASVESSFSPVAYHLNSNGSEDIGLMQINSSWLPTLSRFGISRASLCLRKRLRGHVDPLPKYLAPRTDLGRRWRVQRHLTAQARQVCAARLR